MYPFVQRVGVNESHRRGGRPIVRRYRPLWGDLNPKLGISKNVHVSFITTLAIAGGKNLTLFKKLPSIIRSRDGRGTQTVLNFSTINTMALASRKYWMNAGADNPY